MQITDKLVHINSFHEHGRHCANLDADQRKASVEFNNRIRNSEIVFEEIPCLCGSDQFSLVASVDRYGLIQSTVLCKKCGLMQSIPRMSADQYRFFYESDEYRRLYNGNDFLNTFRSYFKDGRGESIYQTVIKFKNTGSIKTVLEFGAAGGWNLLPFIKQGISARGYDLSRELVKLGNEKGINLCCGGLDDVEGKYDVIIVNHVIEHFTDFLSDVGKLKSHLNPDGIMYVAVPDIRNFSKEQLQNAHTYYFTAETLEYYMGRCGLEMIHHQPEFGGHMSAIFVIGKPQIADDFLKGHYEHIAKMLRKYSVFYYPRRFLTGILNSLGLKDITKRILNRLIKG